MSRGSLEDELDGYDLEQLMERKAVAERRHDELTSKRTARSLGSLIKGGEIDTPNAVEAGRSATPLDRSLKSKITNVAMQRTKRRRLGDVQVAYRLAGQTVFPVAPHQSGIRFETSYLGQYYEQYYVFVEFASDDTPAIFKHTLPPFVPLVSLRPKLDAGGLRPFMIAVSEYLTAFVARRQQAQQLAAKLTGRLRGELGCSASFDFISFKLGVPGAGDGSDGDDDSDGGAAAAAAAAGVEYSVRLLYEELTVAVPTRCSVRARPMISHRDDPAASNTPAMEEHFGRDRRAEAILKKGALPAVVDALLEHLGAA